MLTKYKLFVTGLDGRERGLGTPHETEADAWAAYAIAGRALPDGDGGGELVVRQPEALPVDALADCLRAHAGEEWDERRRRALAGAAASSKSSGPCRAWLEAVVSEDGMVAARPPPLYPSQHCTPGRPGSLPRGLVHPALSIRPARQGRRPSGHPPASTALVPKRCGGGGGGGGGGGDRAGGQLRGAAPGGAGAVHVLGPVQEPALQQPGERAERPAACCGAYGERCIHLYR